MQQAEKLKIILYTRIFSLGLVNWDHKNIQSTIQVFLMEI